VTAGDLTGVPQDAPTDIHSEEERSLVSSERHLAISERQSELSERRKQQVSEEIALSERYQQAVTAELALSARREQQRRQDIALSERQLQLRREELDLAEKYQQQHERAMQTRAQWVPQCQHYLEMSREKTDLLQRSTDLRYDSLRAEYVPSPEEFTFFDACALTATDLMAQHQEYAEPFDVWTFCAQPVWFCRQVGGVQTYGAYKQRPQPLWFYVPKKLAIGYVRRAGTGTEMVNYYENRPGRKEQMAGFIMRHIKLSEGKQHAFSPPYGIDICSDLL